MSRLRYESGLAAEEAAERLYTAQGAEVLARRARTRSGEIDLIVELGDTVIFVEVKARATHAAAAQSLSARQQARIFAAAELWLAENGRSSLTPCRFDVVTLDATGRAERLENAFGQ
ncbi:YraN family protein [Oceanibium sediminis]|uniref:YraN family protein n=1 Tax=Oceanibium sediminis TaxID=2026339 RepID=UPI000DD3FC65|nr:YraN family protein [Oceanibium sediminis]